MLPRDPALKLLGVLSAHRREEVQFVVGSQSTARGDGYSWVSVSSGGNDEEAVSLARLQRIN